MTQVLAALASSVGLVEFVVNPVVGALSDVHDRLPFLLLSPLASLVLKCTVWWLLRGGGGVGSGGGGRGGGGSARRVWRGCWRWSASCAAR